MTIISPRHGTRTNPEAAGLDAEIRHEGGWHAISITESPQIMEVVLTNRTPHAVLTDIARVHLLLRPGILTDTNAIALAPQSEANWSMSLETDTDADGDIRLNFASAHRVTVAPGGQIVIRIAGISADAHGGSRATRVQLGYDRFFHLDGPEISGTHLIHLPVLRRHNPDHLPMRVVRGGSAARSGPLIAGFVDGNGALNDGKSANPLTVRLMNISGRNLRLNKHGDEATRIYVSWDMGRHQGEWGLLSSIGDHLTLALPDQPKDPNDAEAAELFELDKSWQIDGHTLRCIKDASIADGEYIDLDIILHTQAETGQAQLRISFENLPDHDDGDLVLLVDLGPMSSTGEAIDLIKPLNLYGDNARISFHPAESFQATDGDLDPEISASIKVNRDQANAGRLEIQGQHGSKASGADVTIGSNAGHNLGFVGNVIMGMYQGNPYMISFMSGGAGFGFDGPIEAAGKIRLLDDAADMTITPSSIDVITRHSSDGHDLDLNSSGGAVNLGKSTGNWIKIHDTVIEPRRSENLTSALDIGRAGNGQVRFSDNRIYGRDKGTGSTLEVQPGGEQTHFGGPVHINTGTEVSTAKGTGGLIIGHKNGTTIGIDGDEITARQGSAAATLYLNYQSGNTDIGAMLKVRGDTDVAGNLAVGGSLGLDPKIGIEGNLYKQVGLNFATTPIKLTTKGSAQIQGALNVTELLFVGNMPGNNGNDVTWSRIGNSGFLGIESSSKRYKKNIRLLKDDFAAFLKMKPKRYNMRAGHGDPSVEEIGYIAEEMHDQGLERLTFYDDKGRPDGVRYKKITIYLAEILKLQEKRLAALEAKVEKLAKG